MNKLINLSKTFSLRTKKIFSPSRIQKFGIKQLVYEFLVLCCHRNNSSFEHKMQQKKDQLIEKYLKENYGNVISKYYGNNSYQVPLKQASNDSKTGKIFVLWFQGEQNAPELVKMCISSIRQHSNGHDVVVLSEYNLEDWLPNIDSNILEKYKKGYFPKQIFADYIRVSLLGQYGGLWLDSTIYVSHDISDELFNKDFFTVVRKEARPYDISGVISTFLMGRGVSSNNGKKLFDFTGDMLGAYVVKEKTLINYLLIENILDIGLSEDPKLMKEFDYYKRHKKDILGLVKILNQPYEDLQNQVDELLKVNTFSKLNWKLNLNKATKDGRITVYGYLLNISM